METTQISTKIQDDNNQNENIKVIVVSKSSNTLKNNIDIKDDCQRKRTSLQIVPHNPTIENNFLSNSEEQNVVNGSSAIITMPMALEINANEKSLLNRKEIFNSDIIDSNIADINNDDDDNLKNNKNSNRNSVTSVDSTISTKSTTSSTTTTTNTTSSIDGQIITEDYHDLENGNFTDGCISFDKNHHRLSNGSMSSTDDYYLREKLQNIVNESLIQNNNNNNDSTIENCDSTVGLTSDALLSPHEGPIGRRYAEIVQFKNPKWSSETTSSTAAQLLKSRRLPFCGIDSTVGNGNSNGSAIGTINITSNSSNHENCIQDDDVDLDAIDANDGCSGDDDLQALLPNCRQLSRDELSQSRASLVSSSDGGILAEGETSTETSENSTNDSPPCDLGLVERLLRTHPVWFLPGIQRAGAVHLLQGKEEGNFIVRGSSQPNTMAVSVRLPPDTGPYIEHYLIQSNEQILSLESSRFKFDSIPALIAHYAQCCDELPVQLVLPQALRDAKNRQQLSSLALLGQEFWRYPMANPKVNYENVDIKSPNSLTDTSGIGMTVFSTTGNDKNLNGKHQQIQHDQKPNPNHMKMFSPISPMGVGGIFNSQAGTPSDTNSSLSSFTTSTGIGQNHQLMSPESIDSVVLTMSPVDTPLSRAPIGGPISFSNKLSTFKSIQSQFIARPIGIEKSTSNTDQQIIRNQRPTPPNTLNLGPLRMPPAPPVRWSKPLTPVSPVGPPPPTPSTPHFNNCDNTTGIDHSTSNNFTVTTTVTFSVDNKNSQQFVEVTSPTTTNSIATTPTATTFQTFSKRLSPEGECKQTVDTLSSQGSSKRWQQSQSSKDSNNSQTKIISPHYSDTPSSGGGGRQRRIKARKESKHYQESDILESPQVYCRSALGDKISDYEDLWTQDSVTNKPIERGGCLLSSFRPDGTQGKRPDLLPETPNITSLNCNLLSPANSTGSSNNSNHPLNSKLNNEILDTNNLASNITNSTADPTTPIEPNKNFITNESQAQARNRLGLVLNNNITNDEPTKLEIETPTTQTPIQSRSKQGSPFYAEPADALRQAGINANILRRSQRGNLLPVNHRHSEPPKCGVIKNSMCPALIPSEIEKIAGSLDHLKNIPSKIARSRLDPWQVDSSWEFMCKNDDNDEYGDYDNEEQWNRIQNVTTTAKQIQSTSQTTTAEDKENKGKPLTVHQIIAKRLPDLNLPELVRCSTPQSGIPKINIRTTDLGPSDNNLLNEIHRGGYRISSYDNVERTTSYTTSFLNGIDSAHSDDGTVFSEPWDSSQWDSFLPHDGDTSESIHLSKCRPIICNSEDDTLMEDTTIKDNQNTLKANRTEKRHGEKLATILRSRSVRDREVLCHPRNKPLILGGPGDTVRSYTLQLAKDQTSTFARNIENFISCTKESREAAPQVVMRNMRQFMNGMKNYLVKHGEADFHSEVEKARSRLKSDEFLNLDSLLETVMHQLVVLPLREHLYGMFVDYYTRSSDIQLLAENVKYACARNPTEFGIRSTVNPPSSIALQQISILLLRLQEAELPLDKLDLFLCIISAIFDSTGCNRGQQLGADDFLPILVYVVAKCGFVGAEIEAEFMWGLLQPALLNGEAGYYLTALCSAVHVLKCFMASDNDGNGSLDWRSSSMPACSSVLRVIIPDEFNGSLQTRTLPVRPHTTTREVCRIIAHKARITNPQDYGLFKLVDGEETILTDIECPQDARLAARGKHCMLAYKRIDAKIAWPTSTSS